MKTYTAIINNTKNNENSFLVAIIPALPIPKIFKENKDVHIYELAVIAASHGLDGSNEWAYVHLERDEKQTIGDVLVSSCAELNRWYWCNLYVHED